jgi:acetyl-CoA synthetase
VVVTADGAPARRPQDGAEIQRRRRAPATCCTTVKVLVVKRTGGQTTWIDGRDFDYNELRLEVDDRLPRAEMNAEDPLFILYTSGSTGSPRAWCTRRAATSSMPR